MLPKRLTVALMFNGCLVLAVAALGGCKERASVAKLPAIGSSGPRKVRVGQPEVVLDRDRIRATGTAAPSATTKVMPLVPGLVKKLPVEEGDVVQKGQMLALVDQRQYRLALRQAKAALEAAKVGADATEREKQRFEKLLRQDATARAQYDKVLDGYRGAQAQLKQARVAVDMAKKALSDTVLRAPYKGVVFKRMASVGDYATSMPPTVLMVLQQVSTLEIRISLPEPDLPRVEDRADVTVRLPSLDQKIQAKLARINRSVDPMTRSFEVVVELDNHDMKLRPGLYARVSIVTSKPRRRVLIPGEAVVDEGSDVFAVYLLDGDVAKRHEVRVSTAADDKTEVVSGLKGGEKLILDPAGLMDGDRVTTGGATPPAAPKGDKQNKGSKGTAAAVPATAEATR